MTDQPTLAEVARRLDEATAQLTRLADQLERNYVRLDLYTSQRQADRDDVDDVGKRIDRAEARAEEAAKQRAADRRLIFAAFIAPILTGLIVLYVAAQLGGAT